MNIYKITLPNNKFYIGQTIQDDIKLRTGNDLGGYSANTLFYIDIMIFGPENTQVEFIEKDIATQEKLDEREIYWINTLQSWNHKIGYNISGGGKLHSHPVIDPYYKTTEYKELLHLYRNMYRKYRSDLMKVNNEMKPLLQKAYPSHRRGKTPQTSMEELLSIREGKRNEVRLKFIKEMHLLIK